MDTDRRIWSDPSDLVRCNDRPHRNLDGKLNHNRSNMSMSKYTIKRAESERDIDDFGRILVRNGLYPTEDAAQERIDWFYRSGSSDMLLLCDEHGCPVGTRGYGLRDFYLGDEKLRGAIGVDISVNEEHRSMFTGLSLLRDSLSLLFSEGLADFSYGIPNKSSTALYKVAKKFVPVGQYNRYVKPLKIGDAVNTIRPIPSLAVGALNATNLLWHGVNWLHERTLNLLDSERDVLTSLDSADNTWRNNKRFASPDQLLPDRSGDYLFWRYGINPDENIRRFNILLSTAEQATIFYVIIKNRAYVIDYVCPPGTTPQALMTLFAKFDQHCRQTGFSAIVVQTLGGQTLFDEVLKPLWYRRFSSSNKVLFLAAKTDDLRERLRSASQLWVIGDEDAINAE